MKDSKGFIIEHFYDRQLYYNDNLFHLFMTIYNLVTYELYYSLIYREIDICICHDLNTNFI